MDISRRVLLLAAASTPIVAVGCSNAADDPEAPQDPDSAARTSTAQSELELIAAYRTAAAAAEPAAADTYEFLAAQHEEHLAAIFPEDGQPQVPSPSGTVLNHKSLRQLEKQAARQRTEAAITAEDTGLVELLARIAASEAGHAAYLQGGNR